MEERIRKEGEMQENHELMLEEEEYEELSAELKTCDPDEVEDADETLDEGDGDLVASFMAALSGDIDDEDFDDDSEEEFGSDEE